MLFVLVTVLGVWLGYQLNWIRERREAREWLDTHQGIWWPYGDDVFPDRYVRPAPLGIRILGEDGVWSIGIPKSFGSFEAEERLLEFKRLFPEASVEDMSFLKDPNPFE